MKVLSAFVLIFVFLSTESFCETENIEENNRNEESSHVDQEQLKVPKSPDALNSPLLSDINDSELPENPFAVKEKRCPTYRLGSSLNSNVGSDDKKSHKLYEAFCKTCLIRNKCDTISECPLCEKWCTSKDCTETEGDGTSNGKSPSEDKPNKGETVSLTNRGNFDDDDNKDVKPNVYTVTLTRGNLMEVILHLLGIWETKDIESATITVRSTGDKAIVANEFENSSKSKDNKLAKKMIDLKNAINEKLRMQDGKGLDREEMDRLVADILKKIRSKGESPTNVGSSDGGESKLTARFMEPEPKNVVHESPMNPDIIEDSPDMSKIIDDRARHSSDSVGSPADTQQTVGQAARTNEEPEQSNTNESISDPIPSKIIDENNFEEDKQDTPRVGAAFGTMPLVEKMNNLKPKPRPDQMDPQYNKIPQFPNVDKSLKERVGDGLFDPKNQINGEASSSFRHHLPHGDGFDQNHFNNIQPFENPVRHSFNTVPSRNEATFLSNIPQSSTQHLNRPDLPSIHPEFISNSPNTPHGSGSHHMAPNTSPQISNQGHVPQQQLSGQFFHHPPVSYQNFRPPSGLSYKNIVPMFNRNADFGEGNRQNPNQFLASHNLPTNPIDVIPQNLPDENLKNQVGAVSPTDQENQDVTGTEPRTVHIHHHHHHHHPDPHIIPKINIRESEEPDNLIAAPNSTPEEQISRVENAEAEKIGNTNGVNSNGPLIDSQNLPDSKSATKNILGARTNALMKKLKEKQDDTIQRLTEQKKFLESAKENVLGLVKSLDETKPFRQGNRPDQSTLGNTLDSTVSDSRKSPSTLDKMDLTSINLPPNTNSADNPVKIASKNDDEDVLGSQPLESSFERTQPAHFPSHTTFNSPHDFNQENQQILSSINVNSRGQFDDQSPESNALGSIIPADKEVDITFKKPSEVYFIGNGIKLPLQMVKKGDGAVHLSVDVDKLCSCNNISCPKNHTDRELVETIGTILEKEAELKDQFKGSLDYEDDVLGMAAPITEQENEGNRRSSMEENNFIGMKNRIANDFDSMELQRDNGLMLKRSIDGSDKSNKIEMPQRDKFANFLKDIMDKGIESLKKTLSNSSNITKTISSRLQQPHLSKKEESTTKPKLNVFKKITQQDDENVIPIYKTYKFRGLEDQLAKKIDNIEKTVDNYSKIDDKIFENESTALNKFNEDPVIREEVGIVTDVLSFFKKLAVDSAKHRH